MQSRSLAEECPAIPVIPRTGFGALRWIQIAVVSALVVLLFAGVLADMAHDWWTEPELSQGMLIAPLALFAGWVERKRILNRPAHTDLRGLAVTALACFLFVLGKMASEFFLMRLSFVVLLAGIVWTFWGGGRLRALAFPLTLLATMVPLPAMLYNAIAAPLQLLASDIASRTAELFGVSVYRDGNIIQLSNISLGVAEACSGLSALSALVVASMLLGYLLCSRWASRLALVAISVPLAVLVNVLRVAGTAVLADYNQDLAEGFYHMFSGWLVFVGGFALLYLSARLLHAALDRK